MSKFGELIDVDKPVLLDFFTEFNEQSKAMHPVLRDVAAALGDKAKVIKIDVEKKLMLVKGSVPGFKGRLVEVTHSAKRKKGDK